MFSIHLLWCFCLLSSTLCYHDKCSHQNVLTENDCQNLDFEQKDKDWNHANFHLQLRDNILNISSEASWKSAFLRVSFNNSRSCLEFVNARNNPYFNYDCLTFPPITSEPVALEYRSKISLEQFTKKITFFIPNAAKYPVFSYVDFTNTYQLVMKAQNLPTKYNVSLYKVEAFKVRNEEARLVDLRLYSGHEDISFELFTYNDEGDYYFTISVITDFCPEDYCEKSSTPRVYIGRKSTRLVIGIVGASFILPFVLFIFHILTRKFKLNDSQIESGDEKIVIMYKPSFKQHNDVVASLAKLFQTADIIDISKKTEKICSDFLKSAHHLIYIAAPIQEIDTNFEIVSEELFNKEVCTVVFDYCTNTLPPFLRQYKTYKLMDEFEKFVKIFCSEASKDAILELKKRVEEAKLAADKYATGDVPKIVVTDTVEPRECDFLIPSFVL